DVIVDAKAAESMLSISAGIAGSGVVAVGGAVGVTLLNDQTWAYIGNVATSTANGTKVNAGGNVKVGASDDTGYTAVAGALGAGIGAVGVGASVAVMVITKDTKAYVGNSATI